MFLNYSFLKGIIAKDLEDLIRKGRTHHNLIVLANGIDYQLNIDIQSMPSPNVKIFVKDHFDHPLLSFLEELPEGSVTNLRPFSRDYRLDYLRSGIFSSQELAQMSPESASTISSRLDASLHEGMVLFILGDFYDDTQKRERPPHGLELSHKHRFLPPRGLHDIHMNQGTPDTMVQSEENGIYQDGALFVRRPDQTTQAFFFMFDEQCTTTNKDGHCLP